MASLHERNTLIAQPIPSYLQASLNNVQGNILRPHGRNHAAHIL